MDMMDAHAAHGTLWHLLAEGARRRGEAPALLAPERPALTYGALAAQTAGLTRSLRAAGVGPTDRVAIVMSNGPELASAFVGVAAAAACAPLNPAYTARELEFYLTDLRARALLIEQGNTHAAVDVARALGLDIIRIQAGAAAGAIEVDEARPDLVDWPSADDTALLLHTSGTTSRPKLVPLTGRQLIAGAAHVVDTLALTTSDRCLNIMPLFHIHGQVASVLASLMAGSAVVCTDGVYARGFYAWLRQFRPTWYTAVPTMHQAIVERAQEHEALIREVPLRFIRSCSAALPPVVLDQLERVFGAPVIESYGMTEASLQIASNPLPPRARKPGSVGLPAGPRVGIMSPGGALLEAGAVGEIVIRGPNVTNGYERNAAANEAAFTGGWFRTGDLGWLDREGYLYLTGRLKEQINRGGEKIAPREIDEVLLSHPGVRQAAAFGVPSRRLGEEVAAVVELKPGSTLTGSELRHWAGTRLPAFKVPRLIRVVDTIPKGPTGKLQRLGLAVSLGIATLEDERPDPAYVAPRSALEERVAEIWRELLPGARVGVHDRFDALGGDSLLAATMLAAVGAAMGVDVPLTRFVEDATVSALAADIEHLRATRASALVALKPEDAGVPLCILPGHEGSLYAITRLARLLGPAGPVWSFDWRSMQGADSIEMLAASCRSLLKERHQGPYRLAGSCFGGLVAFEMARQARAAGETVELLVLIDTLHPQWQRAAGSIGAAAARVRQTALKVRHHAAAFRRMTPRAAMRYAAVRTRAFFKHHRQTAAARLGSSASASLGTASLKLSFRYEGRGYQGQVLVVRTPGQHPDAAALGWRHAVDGPLEIVDLPHPCAGALSEGNLPVVADALRARLQRSTPAVGGL